MKKPTRLHPNEAPKSVVEFGSLVDIDRAIRAIGVAQDAAWSEAEAAMVKLGELRDTFRQIALRAAEQRAEALRLIG